jgi:predicted O-linked N-acetylglucosamine transferase (SPINDLY family)
MSQLTLQQAFELALRHHQAGQLQQAEQIYRQILAQQPGNPDALHLLGLLAHQVGQHDMAVDLIHQAIARKPNFPGAYSNLGIALKAKGQLDEAIAAFRQAIVLNPHHLEAYSNLGIALKDQGQFDEAILAYRQALALNPNLAEVHNNLGNALREKGQFDEAIAAYQQAVALNPNYPEAYLNLGTILQARGELDAAIAAFRQAIALKPDLAETHIYLGNALRDRGQLDAAIAAFRQAIVLKPQYPEAFNNLGVALKDKGQFDAAIAAFQQAITLKPQYAEAHCNLGAVLKDTGQIDAAIVAFRQAITIKTDYAEAYGNLGLALGIKGQVDAAIAAFRQAITYNPNIPEAYSNLGVALNDKGQRDAAIAAYRQAIVLNPNFPDAHNNLGVALKDQGRFDEAVAAFQRAIAQKPNYADAYGNLGVVLKDQGQLDEAVGAYRQALALAPDNARNHSNFLYTLHFHPAYDAQTLAAEHRRWNIRHAAPLRLFIQPHTNERSPERRLRVGYVSPDFRDHVVGRNLVPLFRNLDRERFETFCYADVAFPDQHTEEFRRCAGTFRVVSSMDHETLAAQIRADGIDILVDLALHMAGNRLLAFARRPAPVQVTFAGYPGSTGLDTIDYRLTDPYLDPPEAGVDELYAEQSIRLPATFWCYDPLENTPVVGPLPALTNGYVTFGCLNNFCKVNEGVLKLWAQVMAGVAGSRLVLLAEEGSHRERTLQMLEGLGVSRQRVNFEARRPHPLYLKMYQQIDIGLDTLPYNGHTTSLDGYFMGVPVMTLVGNTVVGRAGLSQLTNLGMPELIAPTPEEYVRIARDLACDLDRLANIRATLRGRMQASPLMDAPGFTRGIEAAYRQMWRQWCAQTPALR